ncbi:B12-binding domain-containing protein [Hydrogenophaga sp. XSHU_21]
MKERPRLPRETAMTDPFDACEPPAALARAAFAGIDLAHGSAFDDRHPDHALVQALRQRFLQALVVDLDDAKACCQAAFQPRLASAGFDLYLDLMIPAIRTLGEQWETDGMRFEDLSVAYANMHHLLLTHGQAWRVAPAFVQGRPSIVLSTMDPSGHVFGPMIVANLFRSEGWNVSHNIVGQTELLLDEVASRRFDVVGLSVGTDHELLRVNPLCAEVRRASLNPGVRVVAGGTVFAQGHAFPFLDVDFVASSAGDALAWCRGQVSSHRT